MHLTPVGCLFCFVYLLISIEKMFPRLTDEWFLKGGASAIIETKALEVKGMRRQLNMAGSGGVFF